MADQAISALSAVTAPASTDVVPIVNAGATKKVTIANLVKLGNVAIWARVYHTVAQSTTSATPLALNFDSERVDTDTIHDNATNNTRLTCKTAGTYAISGQLAFAANSTGWRAGYIRVNGTTYVAAQRTNNIGGSDAVYLSVNTQYALAVNDYVELVAEQTSGGALNVIVNSNNSPEFMMTRLGA